MKQIAHIDNICAFVEPAKLVLAWTDDESDPQYTMSKVLYGYLRKSRC